MKWSFERDTTFYFNADQPESDFGGGGGGNSDQPIYSQNQQIFGRFTLKLAGLKYLPQKIGLANLPSNQLSSIYPRICRSEITF